MNQTVNAFGYLTQPLAIVYGQAQQKKTKDAVSPKTQSKNEPARLNTR